MTASVISKERLSELRKVLSDCYVFVCASDRSPTLLRRIEDALQHLQLPDEKTAWLIEWPANDNLLARWWHPVDGWMLDASEAARFTRKCDAEAYIKSMDYGFKALIAAEHKWIGAAVETTALPTGPQTDWLGKSMEENLRIIEFKEWNERRE